MTSQVEYEAARVPPDPRWVNALKRHPRLVVAATLVVALVLALSLILRRGLPPTSGRPQYIPPQAWLDHKISDVHSAGSWKGNVKARRGDQIWAFRSPPASWQQLMGTGGECLVRDGKPIDGYVNVVN